MTTSRDTSPSSEYTPLFNRNYLLGLVWLSLIAIIVLSTLDSSEPALYDFKTSQPNKLYTLTTPSDQLSLTIQLPFDSQPAENGSMLREVITSRIGAITALNGFSVSIEPQYDTLSISLSAKEQHWLNSASSEWFEEVDQALCSPLNHTETTKFFNQVMAKTAINANQNQNLLKQAFLKAKFPSHAMQHLDVNAQLAPSCKDMSLLFYGANADQTAERIIPNTRLTLATDSEPDTNKAHFVDEHVSLTLSQDNRRLSGQGSQVQWVMGSKLPDINQANLLEERAGAMLASQLLATVEPKVGFQLTWFQGRNNSFYLWLFNESPAQNQPALERMATQLTEDATPIVNALEQLKQDWIDAMDTAEGQFRVVKYIAQYQLDPSLFNNYVRQVKALTPEQVAPKVLGHITPSLNTRVTFEQ